MPITAKLVANLLVAAGANRILTMDLHAQQIQGFFDIPVDHLYAAPVMYEYLKKKQLPDLVVVSPDVGGLKMAHAYSQVLEAGLAIVAKRRKSATEIEAMAVIGEIRGPQRLAGGRPDGNRRDSGQCRHVVEEKGGQKDHRLRLPRHFERYGHRNDSENLILTN